MNKDFFVSRLNQLGITQRDVAKKLHRHPSVVTYLFNGERDLKAKEIKPLSELLGVTPMDILNNLEGK
jgi:plasmid maintenance system antidote protein VapI